MKRLLVLLVLLAAFFILILALSSGEAAQKPRWAAQPAPNSSLHATPLGFGIADSSGAKSGYAILNISAPSEANISLFLVPQGQKEKVYLLDYPRIEADRYFEFRAALQRELASYGGQVDEVSIEGTGELSRAVLIVPTGAFPQPLAESLPELLARGNAVIYLGRGADFLLDTDSSLVPANTSNFSLGEYAGRQGSGSVLHVKKTLNSYASPQEAAHELAMLVLSAGWETPGSSAQFSVPANFSNERMFVLPPADAREGQLIAIISSSSGNAVFSRSVSSGTGTVLMPPAVFQDENMSVQAILNESYAEPVLLVMSLDASSPAGAKFTRKIGEASVRTAWFNSFSMKNELPPGDYVVSANDQFGRTHASCLLHVKNLSATVESADSRNFVFNISIDGKPVDAQMATVSAGNSDMSMDYPVSGGRMAVFAQLPKGEQFFRARIFGRELVVPYEGGKESALDIYIRYGIPGIIIAVVVILLFRSTPRQKYNIIVPDASEEKVRMVDASPAELLVVFEKANKDFGWSRVPLSVQEFRRAAQRHVLRGGKGVVATDSNITEVLDSLSASGKVSSWRGFYCPGAWISRGKTAAGLGMRRMLRDGAIAKGAKFSEREMSVRSAAAQVKFILAPDGNPKLADIGAAIEKAKAGKACIFFSDEKSMEEFRRSLPFSAENAPVSIALRTGKLVLASPETLDEVI